MKALKNFFANIKWYEYVYVTIFFVTLLVLGIVCKSSALVILNSLLGVITIFCISKGFVIGQVLSLVYGTLYCVLSALNEYYGEVIVAACVTMPLCVVAIVTWIKNVNTKNRSVINVNKKQISLNEWVISFICLAVVSIGMYFLLQALDTANLIVSTFSATIGIFAAYLSVRRSEYNFVFYIINNVAAICLWLSVVENSGLAGLPTVVCYFVFLLLNCTGIINWVKLKRIQTLRKKVLKRRTERLKMDEDYMKEAK